MKYNDAKNKLRLSGILRCRILGATEMQYEQTPIKLHWKTGHPVHYHQFGQTRIPTNIPRLYLVKNDLSVVTRNIGEIVTETSPPVLNSNNNTFVVFCRT